jgi:membrane fusion protein (multidrug efflux system)
MIKRLLIAVVLLAIVCGGLVYFNMFRNQAIEQFFATRQQPAVPVQVVVAEPTSWRPGIEAIGTARAAQGIELSLETSGRIEEVNFSSNDAIEAGQLLVQLDDDVEQAGLVAARAAVKLNEQTLERTLELRSRGVNAEANVEEARANAESAGAEVARLEAVLSQKSLRAPFSGTIGLPQVDEGQYVAAGTAVATLQDLDTMRVDFTVPEQQRDQLDIGQQIRLGSKEGNLDYQGRIIGIEPRIDPNTRLVTVRAEVENTENGLYPGQFVRVRVQLPEEENIIALPQTAVVTSLYGDYVFVVGEVEATEEAGDTGGNATDTTAQAQEASPAAGTEAADEQAPPAPQLEARQVFVTTGRTNGSRIEIVDGLEGGENIVASGQNRLSNGASVTINESESPLEGRETVEQVRR